MIKPFKDTFASRPCGQTIHVDLIVAQFLVQRSALDRQTFQHLNWIRILQQGTVTVSGHVTQLDTDRCMEMDDRTPRAEQAPVFSIQHRTAAGGQHDAISLDQFRDDTTLSPSKSFLASCSKISAIVTPVRCSRTASLSRNSRFIALASKAPTVVFPEPIGPIRKTFAEWSDATMDRFQVQRTLYFKFRPKVAHS